MISNLNSIFRMKCELNALKTIDSKSVYRVWKTNEILLDSVPSCVKEIFIRNTSKIHTRTIWQGNVCAKNISKPISFNIFTQMNCQTDIILSTTIAVENFIYRTSWNDWKIINRLVRWCFLRKVTWFRFCEYWRYIRQIENFSNEFYCIRLYSLNCSYPENDYSKLNIIYFLKITEITQLNTEIFVYYLNPSKHLS